MNKVSKFFQEISDKGGEIVSNKKLQSIYDDVKDTLGNLTEDIFEYVKTHKKLLLLLAGVYLLIKFFKDEDED